jgi:hypothetical protein
MKKLFLSILVLGLLLSSPVFSNSKLIPLKKLNINNQKNYSIILARCSAIQVTELSLNDPNAKKRFDDMGLFIKKNIKFIKFIIPGKNETEDAQNAIEFHEYYVSEYQKALNKSLISIDRSFCTKLKKKL